MNNQTQTLSSLIGSLGAILNEHGDKPIVVTSDKHLEHDVMHIADDSNVVLIVKGVPYSDLDKPELVKPCVKPEVIKNLIIECGIDYLSNIITGVEDDEYDDIADDLYEIVKWARKYTKQMSQYNGMITSAIDDLASEMILKAVNLMY